MKSLNKILVSLFLVLLGLVPAVSSLADTTLQSGGMTLEIVHDGIRLRAASASFRQPKPISIMVVDAQGVTTWLSASYGRVVRIGQSLSCTGTITTAHGTAFHVADNYHSSLQAHAFVLARTVSITSPSAADTGFNSQFSISPDTQTSLADDDCFVPGIWYQRNAFVRPAALASQMSDHYYFFREDRLPLPLVATRDRRTGMTLTLAHLGGNPATFAGESGQGRIIDARMQFGSLGLLNNMRPSPAFLFPGTEGERTYADGASAKAGRWACRSHPVSVGVKHTYKLLIKLGQTPSFPAAVRQTWRTVYDLARPPVIPANLPKIYRDSMNLLSIYCRPLQGTPDVPFSANVFTGKVVDTSSEMGFVGQALPVAALLLSDGLETNNDAGIARASAVVDFWASQSLVSVDPAQPGLPRTWYDIHPDGRVTWRTDQGYLRIASDGMEGALQAWSVMRAHGQDRPQWLAFCRHYGDWLAQVQNPDGSYARRYGDTGPPLDAAKYITKDTTDQVIPFLADLYKATGDAKYKAAALRAGEFCWNTVHLAYAYVGGTPDNPNVMDKEGGMEAMGAFLALYDLSGEPRWVAAAAQAADYSETWVYCWNIPMPPGDTAIQYPRNRTTFGLSLVATGQSGCDNYMAAAPFLYYRLFLLTSETHYRRVAQMLLYDTKQMLDWDSSLGYAYPGLLTEVLSLSGHRGHGQKVWLPWLTVAILEPMVNLHQAFGAFDIAQIDKQARRASAPLPKSPHALTAFQKKHAFD